MMTSMIRWMSEHSFLDRLLDGNGKEKRLRKAEKEAKQAHYRSCRAIEEAAVQVGRVTEQVAELALEDDSQIDIEAVRAEVDREILCKANGLGPTKEICATCKVADCPHRAT